MLETGQWSSPGPQLMNLVGIHPPSPKKTLGWTWSWPPPASKSRKKKYYIAGGGEGKFDLINPPSTLRDPDPWFRSLHSSSLWCRERKVGGKIGAPPKIYFRVLKGRVLFFWWRRRWVHCRGIGRPAIPTTSASSGLPILQNHLYALANYSPFLASNLEKPLFAWAWSFLPVSKNVVYVFWRSGKCRWWCNDLRRASVPFSNLWGIPLWRRTARKIGWFWERNVVIHLNSQ